MLSHPDALNTGGGRSGNCLAAGMATSDANMLLHHKPGFAKALDGRLICVVLIINLRACAQLIIRKATNGYP